MAYGFFYKTTEIDTEYGEMHGYKITDNGYFFFSGKVFNFSDKADC